MKIILVSIGNLQEYIIYNIYNLLLFKNNDICIITNEKFINILNNHIIHLKNKFPEANIELFDCENLNDHEYVEKSKLDKNFRDGFWHYASLRLFYVYSLIEKYNFIDCIHLENDVITFENFELLKEKFTENKVYATFDAPNRVIPGIIYIPNWLAFLPIISNYNYFLNDMENLSRFDESIILPLPIFNYNNLYHKYTYLFSQFNCIFDGAAIGQYLGGVDPRNIEYDTKGFINETCVIKYDKYKFVWIKINELYKPHIIIHNQTIPIINLHIHSKNLENYLADCPIEQKFINLIS